MRCAASAANAAADDGKHDTPRRRARIPSPRFRPLRSVVALDRLKATGLDVHARTPRPTRSRVTVAGGRCPGSRIPVCGRLPRSKQTPSGKFGRRLSAYSCGGSRGIVCSHAPRSLLIPCGNHRHRCCHGWISDAVTIRQRLAKIDASNPCARAARARAAHGRYCWLTPTTRARRGARSGSKRSRPASQGIRPSTAPRPLVRAKAAGACHASLTSDTSRRGRSRPNGSERNPEGGIPCAGSPANASRSTASPAPG